MLEAYATNTRVRGPVAVTLDKDINKNKRAAASTLSITQISLGRQQRHVGMIISAVRTYYVVWRHKYGRFIYIWNIIHSQIHLGMTIRNHLSLTHNGRKLVWR